MITPTTSFQPIKWLMQKLTDLLKVISKFFAHLLIYKVAYISLITFFVFTLRVLYPESFKFGFSDQSYRYKTQSLGFVIGDLTFLDGPIEEAEQKMVSLFPMNLQKKVDRIIRPVLILCQKYDLDPFWVLSVMWTESSFRIEVQSHVGATGLMQVMPQTFMGTLEEIKKAGIKLEADRSHEYLRQKYGYAFNKSGPTKFISKLRNLEVGIYYLNKLHTTFNNPFHATVAYNMGPNWTANRLKNNLPVGLNNKYLNKVKKAYSHITQELSAKNNVTFIPHIKSRPL